MFKSVHYKEFKGTFKLAQQVSEQVKNATSKWEELDDADIFFKDYYLDYENQCGFAVSFNGTLTNVFSLVRGKGDYIMVNAKKAGATNLDCFDGYLTSFYKRHGFEVVRREQNWTPGEPDVCYMVLSD
jgi:hypothetical protein